MKPAPLFDGLINAVKKKNLPFKLETPV